MDAQLLSGGWTITASTSRAPGGYLSYMAFAESTQSHSQAKYIDIKYYYVCKHVHNGDIQIEHVPSIKNLADLFTKALPYALHEYLVGLLGIKN